MTNPRGRFGIHGGQYIPETLMNAVIELEDGDAFILCTDGFWELVNERETIRTLNISQTPREWLDFMLEILESRLKPTSDNYTAVCVLVRED